MTTGKFSYGQLDDGSEIEEIKISCDGSHLSVITWGAVIRDLTVSTNTIKNRRVVLGLGTLQDYLLHSQNFGAIAGRYANRIAQGRFVLDGKSYQLTRNQNGEHHLHGGTRGYGKRPWQCIDHSDTHVTLQITEADGNEGYPGEVTATCTYQLSKHERRLVLAIDLTAETTAPTPINLVHHSYFNLDESRTISDHHLQIRSDSYLPVSDTSIPTGEIRPVEGTPFDFRTARPVHPMTSDKQTTYDHNFVIAPHRAVTPRHMATLSGTRGLSMDVLSTEPGLQVYDGKNVNVAVKGLADEPYKAFAGICMEPQVWPDSPNKPDFPSSILHPGETYKQVTRYEFYEK